MDILELLKTIKEDWALLVFVFGLGGAWIQGKLWFEKTNKILESVGTQHTAQNTSLESLHEKLDSVSDRVDKMENTISTMHEEIHQQDIQLAVLTSTSQRRSRARS